MILVLLLMSKLLGHSNALFPDQILQAITFLGSSCDDSSLVLVSALSVHVVRLAVLVLAGLLVAAGRGG